MGAVAPAAPELGLERAPRVGVELIAKQQAANAPAGSRKLQEDPKRSDGRAFREREAGQAGGGHGPEPVHPKLERLRRPGPAQPKVNDQRGERKRRGRARQGAREKARGRQRVHGPPPEREPTRGSRLDPQDYV